MGHFVESNLSDGEIIKYEARVSHWGQLPLIILGVVTIPIMVGPLFWVIAFLNWWSTELAITDRKIIAKYGFITRRSCELFLNKVETVSIDQGFLGRMFNFGTVIIAGSGVPVPIKNISDPVLFRKRFIQVKEEIEK